ncbi:Succinate dehydrogenase assembly factor 2 mitochondrial [Saitoella coloradoensis]
MLRQTIARRLLAARPIQPAAFRFNSGPAKVGTSSNSPLRTGPSSEFPNDPTFKDSKQNADQQKEPVHLREVPGSSKSPFPMAPGPDAGNVRAPPPDLKELEAKTTRAEVEDGKGSSGGDPFPLGAERQRIIEPDLDSLKPHAPVPRHGESIEQKRRRMLYQSRKRGILETELLMSTFAKKNLDTLSADELHEYDKLLDEADWDIYYWATQNPKRPVPERLQNSSVLKKIQQHTENEGREILRVPDLQNGK